MTMNWQGKHNTVRSSSQDCYTVILPDWTLKKWSLSNFPFQHCYKFIGTINNFFFLKSCEGSLRYSNLSSQISTWTELYEAWDIFWITSKNGTLIAPQLKSFGPKKISNSMGGSKSAILAIFQTGLGWPCTVSAALKNPSQDFKNSFWIMCWWIPSNARRQN